MLALGLRDAEVLVGLLHFLGNLVPAVVTAGCRGGIEDEIVEVQPGEVDAPRRHRLALEDLERLHALLRHPVRLALYLRELCHDLARDALARAQLSLLVLDDGAGLGDAGAVSRAVYGCHLTPRRGPWWPRLLERCLRIRFYLPLRRAKHRRR